MMGTSAVRDGLDTRDAQLKVRQGNLAYTHYLLTVKLKEIEVELAQIKCVQEMNDLVSKDIETDAAIAAAQSKAKENDG